MNDASIIAALIGLVSTLVVAVIRLWQWKQQQITSNRQDYQIECKAAYKQLLDLLPHFSTTIRSDKIAKEIQDAFTKNDFPRAFYNLQVTKDVIPDETALEKSLSDIKLFLLKNAPYIDDRSQYLTVEYVENLIEAKKEHSQLLILLEGVLQREQSLHKLFEYKKMLEENPAPKPKTNPISPEFDFDYEADEMIREQSNKNIVETELSESVIVVSSIISVPSTDNDHIENSSLKIVSVSAISSFVHLLKSRSSNLLVKFQIKWVDFAFTNPTPFRIKLTEILVPDVKQACRTVQSMNTVIKSREKLLTEIKQVLSGEKV